jgi:hypothetical protein
MRLLLSVVALLVAAPVFADTMPEDLLKGQLIVSDSPLPMKWSSPSQYASQLRKINKSTYLYDKSGTLSLSYAAFFADPTTEPQAELVVYDITDKKKERVTSGDVYFRKVGDRVLFNTLTLSQDKVPAHKYLIALEARGGKVLAKTEITLTAKKVKYSGTIDVDP